ncbi:MAG: hypothetical protein ACE148_17450 [Vicinamibacterales bacterium]
MAVVAARACCMLALVLAPAGPLAAQWMPSGPLTLGGGSVVIGAEASVSVSVPEDQQYFNNSTDSYSLLRLVRLDVSAEWKVTSNVALVGDLRVLGGIDPEAGGWKVRPHAAFVRVRPWPGRMLAVQAGIIPPVFGSFSRRAYAAGNPLVGIPLAYHYLTSLRPDSLPASADEVLARRGRGWRVRHSIGSREFDNGVPVVDGLRYPTGVELAGSRGPIEGGIAFTSGSLSESWGRERARGAAISARAAARPAVGLVVGVSAARSGFVAGSLAARLAASGERSASSQSAFGLDLEYSWGHWLLRGEAVHSRWAIPAFDSPAIDSPLTALAAHLEARYRVLPGFYLASRVERLGFGRVTGSNGQPTPWEAPVSRVEIGGGYLLARNLLVKASYQRNSRDASLPSARGFFAAQLLAWF